MHNKCQKTGIISLSFSFSPFNSLLFFCAKVQHNLRKLSSSWASRRGNTKGTNPHTRYKNVPKNLPKSISTNQPYNDLYVLHSNCSFMKNSQNRLSHWHAYVMVLILAVQPLSLIQLIQRKTPKYGPNEKGGRMMCHLRIPPTPWMIFLTICAISW